MKNRIQQPVKKPVSGFLWLFGGLLIGLFVALLAYLQTQPKANISFSEAVNNEIQKSQHTNGQPANPVQNSDKAVQKFDFYTILKDYEVFVPGSEVDNKNTTPVKSTPDTAAAHDDKVYFLQVGSFQANSDADKRRAILALLGITSSIQTAQINQDTWYRVKVGPLHGKRSLNKVRDQLIDNNIPTLIMVMK